MKRLAFWIVLGTVAVNLYRGRSCAHDDRDPGPIGVVAQDEVRNLLGVSSYLQQVAIGGVIIVAVLMDMALRRRARLPTE